MAGLTAQIRKLFEYYQDRKAWFKSLFCDKKVSRKYDDHFYFRGGLFSEYNWLQEMRLFFGEENISELNKYEKERKL